MDEYKRLYYLHRPDLKVISSLSFDSETQTKDVGDLSERHALRKRLNCSSFKWYLDNIIPEKFIPDENVQAYGAVSLFLTL